MSLIESLKSILGSLVNFEKLEATLLSNNKIQKTEYHYHFDGTINGPVNINNGKLSINPHKLPPESQEKLKAFIKTEAFQDCDYFLTDSDSNMKDMEEEIIAKEITKFSVLEKIIPRDDYYALKAALVIRELHRQGKPVEEYKDNVSKIYGERGRKICNICTAGYFEGILELLTACGGNKEDFLQRYNIIVAESAFSIFVHAWKDKEALKKNILERLAANKRYGNHYANIHALGKQNIKTAEEVVRDIMTADSLLEISEHIKSGDTLFMRLQEVKATP